MSAPNCCLRCSVSAFAVASSVWENRTIRECRKGEVGDLLRGEGDGVELARASEKAEALEGGIGGFGLGERECVQQNVRIEVLFEEEAHYC